MILFPQKSELNLLLTKNKAWQRKTLKIHLFVPILPIEQALAVLGHSFLPGWFTPPLKIVALYRKNIMKLTVCETNTSEHTKFT